MPATIVKFQILFEKQTSEHELAAWAFDLAWPGFCTLGGGAATKACFKIGWKAVRFVPATFARPFQRFKMI